jgi:hypothetical protein
MRSAKKLAVGCVLAGLMLAGIAQARDARSPGNDGDGAHDFDFSIGTFKTHIRRLSHPLTGSHTWTQWSGTVATRGLRDGGGDLEELEAASPAGHFEGLTLRLYDASTRKWALYWVNIDNGSLGTPMTGEFARGKGIFCDEETIDGRTVRVRNIYSRATTDTYRFEQALSSDGGKSWETNFVADLSRITHDPTVTFSRSAHAESVPGGQHDFDFELGAWRSHVRRLARPLTGSKTWIDYDGTTRVAKVWDGAANLVELDVKSASAKPLRLISLRLYDPAKHQWNLNVTAIGAGTLGVPTLGGFSQGRGVFYDRETWDGKPIVVRFIITRRGSDDIHFVQAFSADGGKTWETNWIADDHRIK